MESHLQKHWPKIRTKLLAGKGVPSPVKRVEIPKPNGGVRRLGIPTVVDRVIQQMLLQALTPIFDLDIQGFFDNLPQNLLLRAVKQHAAEQWMVLYIERC